MQLKFEIFFATFCRRSKIANNPLGKLGFYMRMLQKKSLRDLLSRASGSFKLNEMRRLKSRQQKF